MTEVRSQSGIDEVLRQEGVEGGLAELRTLLRGDLRSFGASHPPDPYTVVTSSVDRDREYPPEGADAAGALPDDLVDEAALERLADAPRDEAG